MKVEVEMLAFGGGQIRVVDIPEADWPTDHPANQLEAVFLWGQNDVQPQQIPSVSVGDVVRLDGKRYRVESMGFSEPLEG